MVCPADHKSLACLMPRARSLRRGVRRSSICGMLLCSPALTFIKGEGQLRECTQGSQACKACRLHMQSAMHFQTR